MTWTAPETPRVDPPYAAGERGMLDGWLDYQRQTLLHKCAGLTGEQLKLRAVEPSSLSLLGLVRHMAEVERSWFRVRFAGGQVGDVYCSEDSPDADFDDLDTADPEADLATFGTEVDLARTAAAGHSLDETFLHPRHQVEITLRWVYVHMIEEYARHNGHADLIRERVDGRTGA